MPQTQLFQRALSAFGVDGHLILARRQGGRLAEARMGRAFARRGRHLSVLHLAAPRAFDLFEPRGLVAIDPHVGRGGVGA